MIHGPVKTASYSPSVILDSRGFALSTAEIITTLNTHAQLREAAEAALRELNCLIDQAAARGYTSGWPKRVVEKLTAALSAKGEE